MSAHWRRCAVARGRAFCMPASHTCGTGGAAAADPQARAHAAAPPGPVQECAFCARLSARCIAVRRPATAALRRYGSLALAKLCRALRSRPAGDDRLAVAGPAPGLTEAAAQPRLLVGLSLSSGLGRRSRLGPPRPAATPALRFGVLHCIAPFGAAARCLGPLWSLDAAHPPLSGGGHVVLGREWRQPDAQDPQAFQHPNRTPREPL